MYIHWGHKDAFNVERVQLFRKEGAQVPVRTVRVETREVRKRGGWQATYTVYDDRTGTVVAHCRSRDAVDEVIDRLIKEEEP